MLHAYAAWGESCVEHLDGAFAFVVHDASRGRLFGAVDRLGHRAIYYLQRSGHLSFASRPDDLAAPPGRPAVDPDALVRYLLYGHVAAPRSIRPGVRRLPGAHRFTWDLRTGRFALEPWWQLPVPDHEDEARPRAAWIEALRDAFVASVEAQLDVPGCLGVLASGDRASDAIAELARRRLGADRVRTFEPADGLDGPDQLDAILAALDEPVADAAGHATHALARQARGEVTVALSAVGAEVLLAGHRTFRALRGARIYNALVPGIAHRRLIRPALRRRFDRFLRGLKVPDAHRLWRWLGPFEPATVIELVQPGVLGQRHLHGIEARLDWLSDASTSRDLHTRDALLYARTWWPGHALPQLDAVVVATGVPIRTPMLDARFVELAARVPGRARATITREALRPWTSKRPDPPPAPAPAPAAPGNGLPDAPDLLSLEDAGLRPDTVARLLEEHRSGRRDHGHGLRALAILARWRRIRAAVPTASRRAA